MKKTFQLEIVAAESEIYSGPAYKLSATGCEGELQILPLHAPLLTTLAPGPIFYDCPDKGANPIAINGGILEVQPNMVIILADSVIRAEDMDEERALQARKNLEKQISSKSGNMSFAKMHNELALVIAQLRVLKHIRRK